MNTFCWIKLSRQRAMSLVTFMCAAAWLLNSGITVAQKVQLPPGVKMERDIAYIRNGDTAQRLDLYMPEEAPKHPLPLIVHIHGGAWIAGSKFPCPVVDMVSRG